MVYVACLVIWRYLSRGYFFLAVALGLDSFLVAVAFVLQAALGLQAGFFEAFSATGSSDADSS